MHVGLAVVLFLIGLILFFWGIVVRLFSNYNIGYLLTSVVGTLLMLYAFFRDRINACAPKTIKIFVLVLIIFVLCVMLSLYSYGQIDTADGTENALIVLGAGLRGEKPSLTLARRLDKAIKYSLVNPQALLVVSGGQGDDELIPEALSMQRYLVERGVDPARIIQESNAKSTEQNFVFSKQLLDDLLGTNYKIVYITTDFHAMRAGLLAKRAGLYATRFCAKLDWYMFPMSYLREFLALGKLLIFSRQ